MFLINDETLKEVSINLHDSEEKILEKIYSAEAIHVAKMDAEIKKCIDELDNMDTSTNEYEETLEVAVTELVKQIPLQNRTALTHYVARRKLVLELFQKILDKKLKLQIAKTADKEEKSSDKKERQNEEQLLHNLIFQQSASSPESSDLWVLNEEFIYFQGTSESMLKDVEINGEKLLKNIEALTEEEQEYRLSLKEDRYQKRPDILLFPSEGKCIIIEFKAPGVNVADHLTQINNYATLIRNFSRDEFDFTTFYGYLVGEAISPHEIRAHDGDFIHSSAFDYHYRPAKTVSGFFKKEGKNGWLYMEVLKYTSLLERASARNKIFIEKLTKPLPKEEKKKASSKKAGAKKTTAAKKTAPQQQQLIDKLKES